MCVILVPCWCGSYTYRLYVGGSREVLEGGQRYQHEISFEQLVGAIDKELMTFRISRPSESSPVRASRVVSVNIASDGSIETGRALAHGPMSVLICSVIACLSINQPPEL